MKATGRSREEAFGSLLLDNVGWFTGVADYKIVDDNGE